MAGDRLRAEDLAVLTPALHAEGQHGIRAQLALTFRRGTHHTYIARQRVAYPFHVGRGLHMPGDPADMPTYYVQSCSGGIFEHDRLAWQVTAEAGSRLHLGTAAASVVHGMRDGHARQTIDVQCGADTFVEYLPDAVILFPDAHLRSRLRLRAADSAQVLAWDCVIPHDPMARGDRFRCMDAELQVLDEEDALHVRDRYRIDGATQLGHRPGVTARFSCHGSFLALVPAGRGSDLTERLRTTLAGCDDVYGGASNLPNRRGAWARVLAHDAAALKNALQSVWSAARDALGLAPGARRK